MDDEKLFCFAFVIALNYLIIFPCLTDVEALHSTALIKDFALGTNQLE